MKTAGERLREERERRGLTIEEVSRLTKIRVEQIRDLEDNDFGNFPSLVYAKSFLKLYSRFLRVDISDTLEFFEPAPLSDNGVMFFRRPIAFNRQTRQPRHFRFRHKGGDTPLDSPRAPSSPSTRAKMPRSSGWLFWVLGLVMFIGVMAAVKFSIDLSRLKKPEPATANQADANPTDSSASNATLSPIRSPDNRQEGPVAAEGPIPIPGVDDLLAQNPSFPEPVRRNEPSGRSATFSPQPAPNPGAANEPAPPPLGEDSPGPAEIRRAERVQRTNTAAPLPSRPE